MDKRFWLRAVSRITGCWILYLFFSFPSWRDPVMGDEVTVVLWAKSLKYRFITEYFINNGDALFANWHPPTYAYLIGLLGNFTSFNEMAMRSIGILFFLISLALIYAITLELFRKDERRESMASLACFIYALTPFAVKGSMLIDLDIILNVAVLAFILALVLYRHNENSPKKFFLCAALFAVTLSIKNSTPLILVASIFAYQLLRREWKKSLCTVKIAVAGLFLSVVIRLIYCYINKLDFFGIYKQLAQAALYSPLIKYGIKGGWLVLARNVWTPIMWTSPSFAIMAFIGIWEILQTRADDNSLMPAPQFAFYGLVVSVTYALFGGVTHSFPKYHYACVPIFAVLAAAIFIKKVRINKRLLIQMAILFFILLLYNIYFVKDLLYPINYALKEAIIAGNNSAVLAIIKKEAISIVLLLLTIPVAFLFYVRRSVKEAFFIALLITLFASNVSLLSIQRASDYNTVYCYGAKGVREAADLVLSNTSFRDPIFAPREILLLSRRGLSSYTMPMNNKEKFLNRLKTGDIKCVIYGISGNTVEQYKHIFYAEDVRDYLNKKYLPHEAGSYTVWIRKK